MSTFILHLETATEICSVALSENQTCIGLLESSESNAHSKNILPFIDEVLKNNGLKPSDLSAVSVSSGPGSYTGLRIGVSTAKGLAYGNDIPLIAVPTLQIIQNGNRSFQKQKSDFFMPMLDARRMEVYLQLFDSESHPVSEIEAKIVENGCFNELLSQHYIVFCGNGMPKCQSLLSSHYYAIFGTVETSAKFMIEPALEKYRHQQFENTAYFEPFYLKQFIAGKPKVKGLYE